MHKAKFEWPRFAASDLIARKVLYVGDGYRAKNSEMGPTGLPFARAGNINGGFLFDGADLLDENNVPKAGNKVSVPGDIVFTSKGTVGRFAFVRPSTLKFVYSPQLCFWRVLDSTVLDARFLLYWMQSSDFLSQVQQVKGLTDMADYVSLSDQRRMKLTVPSLPVQNQIASILSAYDDLIENNTRRIKILEEMAQMLYREWFVNFRFPGHHNVKMVESELGPIPEGWNAEPLVEVYKTGSGGTPSRKIPSYYGGGIPWVKTQELKDGFIHNTDEKITEEGLKNSSAKLHPPGAVLMAMYGATIGKLGMLALPATCNQACCALTPKEPHFGPEYIFLTLLNRRTDILALRMGAAQQNISQEVIKAFPLMRPKSDVMDRFNETVKPLMALIGLLQAKNANLRTTRDLLLPKLISGEIPVETAAEAMEQTA